MFPNLIPHKMQYINGYICKCLALFFILVFIRLPEYHILQFHAFLLDRNFRVLVVGDPMRNLEIRNLYLKHILGMQPDWVKLETTAIVDDPIKDVGEIAGNKPVRHSFKIRNTGLSPLIVTDVATTCGCMQYEYDKKPVDSGKELIFTLIYTPKHSGFFSETVLVRCNTNKAIKIILKGKIKPAQQEL